MRKVQIQYEKAKTITLTTLNLLIILGLSSYCIYHLGFRLFMTSPCCAAAFLLQSGSLSAWGSSFVAYTHNYFEARGNSFLKVNY